MALPMVPLSVSVSVILSALHPPPPSLIHSILISSSSSLSYLHVSTLFNLRCRDASSGRHRAGKHTIVRQAVIQFACPVLPVFCCPTAPFAPFAPFILSLPAAGWLSSVLTYFLSVRLWLSLPLLLLLLCTLI